MKTGFAKFAATSGMLIGSAALTWTAHAKEVDDFYTVTGPGTATAGADIPEFTALTDRENLDCRTSTFPGEDRVADIPHTSLTFHQGGHKPGSVVVTFVANWPIPTGSDLPPASQPAGAVIFLTIDGQRVDVASDGGVLVHEGTATSVSNGTQGFTFVARVYFRHRTCRTRGPRCYDAMVKQPPQRHGDRLYLCALISGAAPLMALPY
jgi:hypothetical protein